MILFLNLFNFAFKSFSLSFGIELMKEEKKNLKLAMCYWLLLDSTNSQLIKDLLLQSLIEMNFCIFRLTLYIDCFCSEVLRNKKKNSSKKKMRIHWMDTSTHSHTWIGHQIFLYLNISLYVSFQFKIEPVHHDGNVCFVKFMYDFFFFLFNIWN